MPGTAMSTDDQQVETEHPDDIARNTRSGLWLFALYAVIYAGFVGLAVCGTSIIAKTPFAGANLAILYGFGLIALALILALIYLLMCRTTNNRGH
jgi:uncharacterized membrane protein (DUF485 family)